MAGPSKTGGKTRTTSAHGPTAAKRPFKASTSAPPKSSKPTAATTLVASKPKPTTSSSTSFLKSPTPATSSSSTPYNHKRKLEDPLAPKPEEPEKRVVVNSILNAPEEIDFPRGGGTNLTQVEVREAQLEGRNEAQAEDDVSLFFMDSLEEG